MTRPTKAQSESLRQFIESAINDGARTPQAIRDYMMDNGYEGEMPTRVTIEAHMKRKLVYVAGRWEQK